jgi:hypothetical protein
MMKRRCRVTVECRVWIPARLSHTGRARWAIKPVDACLKRLIEALLDAGARPVASCCGHGTRRGEVVLEDGTRIRLKRCRRRRPPGGRPMEPARQERRDRPLVKTWPG